MYRNVAPHATNKASDAFPDSIIVLLFVLHFFLCAPATIALFRQDDDFHYALRVFEKPKHTVRPSQGQRQRWDGILSTGKGQRIFPSDAT